MYSLRANFENIKDIGQYFIDQEQTWPLSITINAKESPQ